MKRRNKRNKKRNKQEKKDYKWWQNNKKLLKVK